MYDRLTGSYVCLQDQLVRHVNVASVPAPLAVRPPLRMLGVVSAPRGLPPLDVDGERDLLMRALAKPIADGLVEVTWAPAAIWADLQELLLGQQWHVVHFIGHGGFDPVQDEGMLVLTDEHGRADPVEAHRFCDLLREARPRPRLVVLNSCSGAAVGVNDLFSGTAAALVRGGVSAVAAMQYEISDAASVAFSRGFYSAIAHGRGVDDAVSSGRRAIRGTSGRTLEWLTPVLYLRGDDSRLFSYEAEYSTRPTEPPIRAVHEKVPVRAQPVPPRSRSKSKGPARLARTLTGHTGSVNGVAFSPDGNLLATTSSDSTAQLWDTATGALLLHILTGHTNNVLGVAFSPDGNMLATGSDDRTARFWDTATGTPINSLAGHTNAVRSVTFSPDGNQLATASNDKTARLWDAITGTPIHTLSGHTGIVWAWHSARTAPCSPLLALTGRCGSGSEATGR